ncbi:RecQ family zinc-binding domain-containing protein [Salinibacterium sp. SYSU T00001]|uniref:DUF3553 domain-containing protein n=1 Tax=Homoserinimonas sedimenticola TaxID=2986805 RepID=UPI002236ABD2|nr:DUF3553 domain-containing protein [Salinibacterium sedimenticola]MCW4384875.1 RecQ family zinc-binding domain-containing protein [Salinibacterium sedimenticola]
MEGAYRAVVEAPGAARPKSIAAELEVSPRTVTSALNLLSDAGLVRWDRRGAVVIEQVDPATAAERARAAAEERERIEESRIEMMRGYAETSRCRRAFLLGYFGEETGERCGNCDTCESGHADAADAGSDASGAFLPNTPVSHEEFGAGTVMDVDGDRITVFFEHEGYKVLSREAVEERGLLEPR